MAWIAQTDPSDASVETQRSYTELAARRGEVLSIAEAHSLNPEALKCFVDTALELMFGESGLSRAEREAIAVVVSATNNCTYCVNNHAEALARFEQENEALKAMISGLKFMSMEGRAAAMLRYAVALTRAPAEVREQDVDDLRSAGLSDRDILDLNLIIAHMNYVNRVALGLGVKYTEDSGDRG